jgi:hypothetical protein
MGGYGKTVHFIDHPGGLLSGDFSDPFFVSDPLGRGQIR